MYKAWVQNRKGIFVNFDMFTSLAKLKAWAEEEGRAYTFRKWYVFDEVDACTITICKDGSDKYRKMGVA